jgi:hypothetical protein
MVEPNTSSFSSRVSYLFQVGGYQMLSPLAAFSLKIRLRATYTGDFEKEYVPVERR